MFWVRDCCVGPATRVAARDLAVRAHEHATVARMRRYDGLAADIWSLGLCFMELICGPYSIEQRMGWLPSQPTEPNLIYQSLQRLPDRWAQAMEEMERTSHLEVLVTQLLVIAPEDRLK